MSSVVAEWKDILRNGVERVRKAKRLQTRLEEWFFVQEIRMEESEAVKASGADPDSPSSQAEILRGMVARVPLSILSGSAIAGTQDGAFSPSYALINPSFKVEEFAGYCDPTAIYQDVSPNPASGITRERIDRVKKYWENSSFVKNLHKVYSATGDETAEVVYFVEPVTGHTIPDLRPYLKEGVCAMREKARRSAGSYGEIMANALDAVLILADRYRALAVESAAGTNDEEEKARLQRIAEVLERVPAEGARNFHEAVQSFVLLWQVMVLEQAPNPYAFSVGNLDRILAPYYDEALVSREESVELVRNLLTFLQVGDRCWAISQNVMVGGRDEKGNDLTSETTHVVLDAFFDTNDPQPALSVKLHKNTPEELYRALGRLFFTPGHSTPSIFNDDVLFGNLRRQGIAEEDLPDYCIAGCQEPLIMGKASLNTTNTWLNLAKILELAANDGRSLISGNKIGPSWKELGESGDPQSAYEHLDNLFLKTLEHFLPKMQDAGNACTSVLGRFKPVPFTSAVMDGIHTGRDLRDPENPGARYNGSGCLIHGLSVVTDSLLAVRKALSAGIWTGADIRSALQENFANREDLREFLLNQEKFGNNQDEPDTLAVQIAEMVSDRVGQLKNAAGKPYLADWSTPSTHLLYGYWVGATPDGRRARTMLGYGLDPRPETTRSGLEDRILSAWKLPYFKMTGGYASHLGIRPGNTPRDASLEEKGLWMRDRIIRPLFRLGQDSSEAPYYAYFNVDSGDHLREVLKNPRKYAPDGIYIMRIHGTFVNFLDLSPAIQEDIIARLEAAPA